MNRLLASILLLCGCPDNTNNNGGITTFSDYQQRSAGVICLYFIRCGIYSPSQANACEAAFNTELSSKQVYDPDQAVAAGRLAFDSAAAKSCLDAISSLGCDITSLFKLDSNSACQSTLKGLVPAGKPCQSTTECTNGFCQGSSATGCPGTCVAFAATGASCATALCAKSDFCKNSICVARGSQGAACTSTSECVDGLSCSNSTCGAAAAEGAPCSGIEGCQTGLYCDSFGGSSTCKKPLQTGGSCIVSFQCADGLRCSSAGTCQAIADVGQSCTTLACAGDASCDPTMKTCKLSGQVGDNCTPTCALNLYCDPATNKCAQKVPYGGACNGSAVSPCAAGTCSPTTNTCTKVCS
jgi:hypothetical protein